jgi:predicted MFS family arabinose efflux permease
VLAGFCAFLSVYPTQPILPLLARVFHASALLVSLTVTATTLGIAVTAPFAGRFSDRYGRKRTIVWSAAALSIATFGAAASGSLETLLAWRFLQGVFTPGIFAVTVAYIHDEWNYADAGRATAAYVGGTVIGGFSGRFVSGFTASHSDWHTVFIVLGALNLAGAAAIQICLPAERRERPRSDPGFAGAAAAHLKNPRLAAAYGVGFCVLFSLTSTFTYINFYLAAPPFNLLPASLGTLFFVYLAGAVITPASGRYIDRYGHRAVLAAAISAGIAGVLLTLVHRLMAVIAGLTICSSGVFIAQACSNSFVGIAARRNRALAVGLYVTAYNLGGSAGAALPGFLWRSGGWPACVTLIVCVQALTITLALRLWSKAAELRSNGTSTELG